MKLSIHISKTILRNKRKMDLSSQKMATIEKNIIRFFFFFCEMEPALKVEVLSISLIPQMLINYNHIVIIVTYLLMTHRIISLIQTVLGKRPIYNSDKSWDTMSEMWTEGALHSRGFPHSQT